jgi:hypothetical protein
MLDSRTVMLTERATAQRDANARTREAGATLPSLEAPHSTSASVADHESNQALLKQIISMLAGGAPARAPRQPTPARHARTPAWERRSRSPPTQRSASQHPRQGQDGSLAARRFNTCYRCGRTHFPYCRRNEAPPNHPNSPSRGRSQDRRVREMSLY